MSQYLKFLRYLTIKYFIIDTAMGPLRIQKLSKTLQTLQIYKSSYHFTLSHNNQKQK